jgi:hypothetical protein
MHERAEIGLMNPTGEAQAVRLTLEIEAFEHERPLTIRSSTGGNFTLPVSRERMHRSLHLLLPPGEHVLYLSAPADAPPGQPARRISVAFLGIAIEQP